MTMQETFAMPGGRKRRDAGASFKSYDGNPDMRSSCPYWRPLEVGQGDKRMTFPKACGRCWRCVARKVNEVVGAAWTEVEESDWQFTIVTTYAGPDKCPARGFDGADEILEIRHGQDFEKALRLMFVRQGIPFVRIMKVGETGEKNGRPHFHFLVWGWGPAPTLKFRTESYMFGPGGVNDRQAVKAERRRIIRERRQAGEAGRIRAGLPAYPVRPSGTLLADGSALPAPALLSDADALQLEPKHFRTKAFRSGFGFQRVHIEQWPHGFVQIELGIKSHKAFRYSARYMQKGRAWRSRDYRGQAVPRSRDERPPREAWFQAPKRPALGTDHFRTLAALHHQMGTFMREWLYLPPGIGDAIARKGAPDAGLPGAQAKRYGMSGAAIREYILAYAHYAGVSPAELLYLPPVGYVDDFTLRKLERVDAWAAARSRREPFAHHVARFALDHSVGRLAADLGRYRPRDARAGLSAEDAFQAAKLSPWPEVDAISDDLDRLRGGVAIASRLLSRSADDRARAGAAALAREAERLADRRAYAARGARPGGADISASGAGGAWFQRPNEGWWLHDQVFRASVAGAWSEWPRIRAG